MTSLHWQCPDWTNKEDLTDALDVSVRLYYVVHINMYDEWNSQLKIIYILSP